MIHQLQDTWDSSNLTMTQEDHFFWKGMQKDIQQYVVECDKCQRNKSENVFTPGLFHPLHIPNQKWEEISMDFIEGLPLSEGKDKILVVVDRLTKFAHFMAIRKTCTSKQIADIFCKNIYKLHGSQKPSSVTEMQNLMENFGGNSLNKWVHHSI